VRCPWSGTDELYVRYHDEEWGTATHDDRRHFEFLVLESAQAGLSWITILRKRENYRKAYRGFDPAKVARFGPRDVERLLADGGIVRNRAKIEASIANARLFLEMQREWGSFDAYLWSWTGGTQVVGRWKSLSEVPARTELSDALASDMKKRGFRFLGSTIMYSHLQAVGVVDDHLAACFRAAPARAPARAPAPSARRSRAAAGGSPGPRRASRAG
jgi:DNA-3-methyladenine glycosylase I